MKLYIENHKIKKSILAILKEKYRTEHKEITTFYTENGIFTLEGNDLYKLIARLAT